MRDHIDHWFAQVRVLTTTRTPGCHTPAHLRRTPAERATTEQVQTPGHDATLPDGEATSLVRLYVIEHEHHMRQAQATRHIDTSDTEVPQ